MAWVNKQSGKPIFKHREIYWTNVNPWVKKRPIKSMSIFSEEENVIIVCNVISVSHLKSSDARIVI